MATKPDAKDCLIKEQIIDDLASGLTLQFEYRPKSDCPFKLLICGAALPFGNREIFFDKNGEEAAAGTYTGDCPRPTWIKEIPAGDSPKEEN